MGRFENKVALVTGGGTGIGKAIAEAFAADGGKVVVTGRREAPLKALSESNPDSIRYFQMDVSKTAEVKAAVDSTVKTFGGLDTLVNNAGAYTMKPLVEMSDKEIDLMLDINLKGTLVATREAIEELAKRGGSVVNTSSIGGQAVLVGSSVYSSAKAGVNHATRLLAAELGPRGIRVNAVAPGPVETDMTAEILKSPMVDHLIAQTPLGRIGKPQDIARAVVFLASDDASWITGQIVQSGGGWFL